MLHIININTEEDLLRMRASMKQLILVVTLMLLPGISLAEEPMNQALMESIVKDMVSESTGENGVVEFKYGDVNMYLISDVKHNRMRLIAPIAEYKQLNADHIDAVLESNFHKALDARYAVSDGVLYSAYIHPLSELSRSQIKSAVVQVANLALSFGNEYTSGVLSFGGEKPAEENVTAKGEITL